MPLSDAKIRALHSTDKPYKVAGFDGLFLLVKLSGAKSWRFKYRTLGKEKLLVIGDYPAISLSIGQFFGDGPMSGPRRRWFGVAAMGKAFALVQISAMSTADLPEVPDWRWSVWPGWVR